MITAADQVCKTTFADALMHMGVGGGIAIAAISLAAGVVGYALCKYVL